MKPVIIVGAGISGASLARLLADRGMPTILHESAPALGGMCRELQWNGQLVSEFGPHIFRSSNPVVWQFMDRFAQLTEAPHSVVTSIDGEVVPFPPLEARSVQERDNRTYASIGDYLIGTVGAEIFGRFYESYTRKRWGVSAFDLAPDMIPLIPVFRYPRGFFQEKKVGIPAEGYTRTLEKMVDHKLITVLLCSTFSFDSSDSSSTVVWTGKLDGIMPDHHGELSYRGVAQTFSAISTWPETSVSVINYPGRDEPFIRRTNYRLLMPWKPNVVGTEMSSDDGYPAYPVRTHAAVSTANRLLADLMSNHVRVIPHGRLGRFQYISMDAAIEQSMALANQLTS